MKKILFAIAATAALATAVPVMAQPSINVQIRPEYSQSYDNFRQREQAIQFQITRAEHRGELSRREAYNFRQDLYQIVRVHARYNYDHRLQRWERRDLDQRLDRLERNVRAESRDRGYRNWDRQDYWRPSSP